MVLSSTLCCTDIYITSYSKIREKIKSMYVCMYVSTGKTCSALLFTLVIMYEIREQPPAERSSSQKYMSAFAGHGE